MKPTGFRKPQTPSTAMKTLSQIPATQLLEFSLHVVVAAVLQILAFWVS
jgi:hypothetical protein